MNKQLRKQVRAQLVKDLRDLTKNRTPIDDILNGLADKFNCKRSDIYDAISKDENDIPKTVPDGDAWPFPKSS